MKKIYLSDNYIIVDIDGKLASFPKGFTEYEESSDSFYIRRISTKQGLIIPFQESTSWYAEDGITPYDTASLRTFLRVNSGFNTASGGSGAVNISQKATDYASLVNGEEVGELAYVENSQGTKWLPGTLGGTYYPAGWYVWNGTNWVSDRNAIAKQLQDNIDDILNHTHGAAVISFDDTLLETFVGTNVQAIVTDIDAKVYSKTYIDTLVSGYQQTSEKGVANGYASLDANGKVLGSQIPDLAIVEVLTATETSLAAFAAASASYEYEEGDVIIIDNGAGNISHYLYKGGIKTDVNEYSQINSTTIDASAIVSGFINPDRIAASDVLAKMLTVDGSGSGLDADLLDGLNGDGFAKMNFDNSGNIKTIGLTTSVLPVFDFANFAQQTNYGSEPIGFTFHHYTDGNMIQIDNVGEANTILKLKNAQNAIRRPDKASSFVGTGNFLSFDRHNDVLGFSENLMAVGPSSNIQWSGVGGITNIYNNKDNNSAYSIRIGTNKNNLYPLTVWSNGELLSFKDSGTFTRADIVSGTAKTNGLFLGTNSGPVTIAPNSGITNITGSITASASITALGLLRGGNNSGIHGTGVGTANASYFSFFESNGSTRQGYIGFGSTSNNDLYIRNDVANKQILIGADGVFLYNGDAVFTGSVTATSFPVSSDRRLKENIQDLDTVINVNWKSFNLKTDPNDFRVGVIAQELELNHPEFVTTNDEGMKAVKYIDLLCVKVAELEKKVSKLEQKNRLK